MCFLRFSKRKGVDNSDPYYFKDKGSIKSTSKSSFILVIYLLKEIYRKIMSEIHFVGKTRYEDLTETGS